MVGNTRLVGRWLIGGGLLAGAMLLAPTPAEAQIWVVEEPDGTRRFTTVPEPGAEVYIRTHHSRRATPTPPGVPYGEAIAQAAARTGVEPELITAVIAAESNFDPMAVSSKGARGLMQLMPATAQELGVSDVWDPGSNILGGSRHLARLIEKFSDLRLALAAYNAGEGSVQRYGGVPPFDETREYVRRVLDQYRRYGGGG